MTPAKPQHMSGQPDNSDDLMTELAKLMAGDVKEPAGAAVVAPRAVPAEQTATAPQPFIRIPGMNQPPLTPPPASSPGKFDFGKPPTPAPIISPEPLSTWQDRLSRPQPQPQPAPQKPEPATAPKQEPVFRTAPPPPSPSYSPSAPAAQGADAPKPFEFDFGFANKAPEAAPRPAASVVPTPPIPAPSYGSGPQLDASHDAIADLIAAELDAAYPQQAPVAPAIPVVPVAAQYSTAPVSRPAEPPLQPPLRQVNFAARQVPPENDRFTTAPVFGLGGKLSRETAPAAEELDPMDEIENLIGEAVRVELAAPPPELGRPTLTARPAQQPAPEPESQHYAQPQQQPVVPPLNAQFAPRRTTLREPDGEYNSADDAILAAAAATGAEVGRIRNPTPDESDFGRRRAVKQPRERAVKRVRPSSGSAFRQLVVPAIAGTLLVAAGFGAYWYLGMGHNDGKVPTLVADTTPAKAAPKVAPVPTTEAPRSVVLDQLSGTAPAAGKEQLVSRDQTDGNTDVATAAPQAAAGDTGIANRKVRTVTVRPDGTIVSGEDSVAGSAKLPVDRPNVPAVPGASDGIGGLLADAGINSNSSTDTTSPGAAPVAAGASAAAATAVASSTPTTDPVAAGNAYTAPSSDVVAPIPMPRPANRKLLASAQPTSAVNAVVSPDTSNPAQPVDLMGNLATEKPGTAPRSAPLTTAETSTPPAASASSNVATTSSGGAPAYAQLSSQRSAGDAQAALDSVQRKFGSALGAGKLEIVRVDLGAKGIYFRVRVPAASLQDAAQICSSVKASGGDCIPTRG